MKVKGIIMFIGPIHTVKGTYLVVGEDINALPMWSARRPPVHRPNIELALAKETK